MKDNKKNPVAMLWGNCSLSPLDPAVPRSKDRKLIKKQKVKNNTRAQTYILYAVRQALR